MAGEDALAVLSAAIDHALGERSITKQDALYLKVMLCVIERLAGIEVACEAISNRVG